MGERATYPLVGGIEVRGSVCAPAIVGLLLPAAGRCLGNEHQVGCVRKRLALPERERRYVRCWFGLGQESESLLAVSFCWAESSAVN